MADKLRVTLRKSPISYTAKTRGTVRAMGLRRIGQTIELPDNPATRGMTRAVRFLVEVEQVAAERPAAERPAAERPAAERPAAAARPAAADRPAAPARRARAAPEEETT
jgi:large subunit ribosomal protein L30